VFLLLLTLIAAQDVAPPIAAVSESLVGKPAPPIRLDLLSGAPFDLADHKGKVVFLAFWATWCEPCRREIPRLLHAEGNYKDLVVLGISTEPRADVASYLEDEHFDFRTAIDADSKVSKAYGIDLVPRLFVIDQKGIVVKMIRGLPGEGTIKRILDTLLPRSIARSASSHLTLRLPWSPMRHPPAFGYGLFQGRETLLQRYRFGEGEHKATRALPVAFKVESNRNNVRVRAGNRLDGIDDDARLLIAQQIR
jgi:peroxiredoxin